MEYLWSGTICSPDEYFMTAIFYVWFLQRTFYLVTTIFDVERACRVLYTVINIDFKISGLRLILIFQWNSVWWNHQKNLMKKVLVGEKLVFWINFCLLNFVLVFKSLLDFSNSTDLVKSVFHVNINNAV